MHILINAYSKGVQSMHLLDCCNIYTLYSIKVAHGPMGYKKVEYVAFRYRDLNEGRDGAHLIVSVKPFKTLGSEYEIHIQPIDLLHE